MNALSIHDWKAHCFAVGDAANCFSAARAFQVHETAGAFATIRMALNASSPVESAWSSN
ncbi:LrgB family protein [Cognatishimia maritima]|uniref:LrgB family protein n=1 Tax=Cognatishimia maritima TaxID=870908 RepID=UPI000A0060FE|nr:LrgB family protein [Cognatishimia maritima]